MFPNLLIKQTPKYLKIEDSDIWETHHSPALDDENWILGLAGDLFGDIDDAEAKDI